MREPPRRGAGTALGELCRTLGVETAHESGGGVHPAPPETVLAALRTLGAPLERPDEAAGALRAVRAAASTRLVPPTVVCWTGEPAALPIRLPLDVTPGPLELEIVLEDGSRARRTVDPGEIRWTGERAREGRTRREGRIPLPAELPDGYHAVRLSAGGAEGRTSVVRAPPVTWSPPGEAAADGARRRWGSFLPLHAVRTGRGWGAGDLADLRDLTRWTAGRGGSVVGTLPLYDTFLGDRPPFDPSPYAPVSRLFWNPLWIALEDAPGLDASPGARDLLQDGGLVRRARELEASDRVDYRRVMALKRTVLEALAEGRRGDGPHGLGPDLARWVHEDPETLAYARFRAAVEATAGPWTRWEGPARGGDAASLDAPDDGVRYHVYAQWTAGRQLRELAAEAPAALYLDLPLGSHRDGFDHWRHQERFAGAFTVGAPPDAFFEAGQDWGFPPLHPRRIREDGHRYWADCLRRVMAVAGVVRLDHVMSLHRLFWVPRGARARNGVYVRYPAEELWAVLCLESHRNETEVVGEDLGTVPPEVPEAMERRHARRMWVLPFEVAANGSDRGYRATAPGLRSVASLGTHDLPPFAAFVDGLDIDARVAAGRLDEDGARTEREGRAAWRAALMALLRDHGHLGPGGDAGAEGEDPEGPTEPDAATLLQAALRFLSSSEAGLVLVNLEDLWLETGPQNVPGTPSSSNWIRKARLSLEEMASDPRVRGLLELVDTTR